MKWVEGGCRTVRRFAQLSLSHKEQSVVWKRNKNQQRINSLFWDTFHSSWIIFLIIDAWHILFALTWFFFNSTNLCPRHRFFYNLPLSWMTEESFTSLFVLSAFHVLSSISRLWRLLLLSFHDTSLFFSSYFYIISRSLSLCGHFKLFKFILNHCMTSCFSCLLYSFKPPMSFKAFCIFSDISISFQTNNGYLYPFVGLQ